MIKMVPDFQMTTRHPFLRFKLGEKYFAVPVCYAINILEMTGITWTSQSPSYLKGFIGLREGILPLVDIRILLNMKEAPPMAGACILVLDIHKKGGSSKIGMLVDSIPEFFELSGANMMPPPRIGYLCKPSCIKGIAMVMDEFVVLLNAENILSYDDVIELQKASGQMQHLVH